jgi:hypothetical protein
MRRAGMAKMVDGYGVHVNLAGDPHRSVSTLFGILEKEAFAFARPPSPAGSRNGGSTTTKAPFPSTTVRERS